jgi:exonuclease VII large subunit
MSDELDDELDDFDDVFADEEIDGPGGVRTYSIAELAEEINDVLRDYFDEGLWVWGEISGISTKNGNTYFSLVDADDGGRKVQVNVNLWKRDLLKMQPTLVKRLLRGFRQVVARHARHRPELHAGRHRVAARGTRAQVEGLRRVSPQS